MYYTDISVLIPSAPIKTSIEVKYNTSDTRLPINMLLLVAIVELWLL